MEQNTLLRAIVVIVLKKLHQNYIAKNPLCCEEVREGPTLQLHLLDRKVKQTIIPFLIHWYAREVGGESVVRFLKDSIKIHKYISYK